MKISLLACIIASLPVHACPDLEGRYECRSLLQTSDGKSESLRITQSLSDNGFVLYHAEGLINSAMLTDGRIHTEINPDGPFRGSVKTMAKCSGDKVTMKKASTLARDTTSLRKKGDDLIITGRGVFLGVPYLVRYKCH